MNEGKRQVPRNPKRRTKWNIIWKVLLCIAFLSFLAIDGYRSIRRFQYWQRNKEIKKGYVQAVEGLRQEKGRLEKEVHDLKNRPLTQERLAREMGYIRPGETVYKLSPKPYETTPGPTE